MKHRKTKLGLGGFLAGTLLVLGLDCANNSLVSKEILNAREWVSRYESGERIITKFYGPLLEQYVDENGDNKIDELRVCGGSQVSGPFAYKLRELALDDRNFEKEEEIFRKEKERYQSLRREDYNE